MTPDSERPYPFLHERDLQIEFDADLDILTLWDGTPADTEDHVAKGLVVFTDDEDLAHIVTWKKRPPCSAHTSTLKRRARGSDN